MAETIKALNESDMNESLSNINSYDNNNQGNYINNTNTVNVETVSTASSRPNRIIFDWDLSNEVNERMTYIYYYLKDNGLTDVEIAALMGNIARENGIFSPSFNTERLLDKEEPYCNNKYVDQWTGEEIISFDITRADDESYRAESKIRLRESNAVPIFGGIGLLQWTDGKWDSEINAWVGGKKAAFLNWCNYNDRDWNSMDTQLDYIVKEFNKWKDNRVNPYENINSNPAALATEFAVSYEQPGDDSYSIRSDKAKKFYDVMQNEFGIKLTDN